MFNFQSPKNAKVKFFLSPSNAATETLNMQGGFPRIDKRGKVLYIIRLVEQVQSCKLSLVHRSNLVQLGVANSPNLQGSSIHPSAITTASRHVRWQTWTGKHSDHSTMVLLSATATFQGKDVKVEVKDISDPPKVVSTFVGKLNNALTGTSEGQLEYYVLPEGNHSMVLSVTEGRLVINFFSESAAQGAPADPQFKGTLFGSPEPDNGGGTWISMNFYQQVFLLSVFSNVIRAEVNTVKNLEFIARIAVKMAVSIVGWEIVWGPVVWKNDPNNISGPDHVWFVAKKLTHTNEHIYVISVAGSATIYNTVVNNAGIIPLVDFTTWAAGAPPVPSLMPSLGLGTCVALGTAMGVHTLESYPAPAGAEGAGQTLPAFLKNAPRGSGSQFIFTGFSLGGTLSPTLALRLVQPDANVFTDADKILTYPIAGASPGNVQFANAFAGKFPKSEGSGYQVWNTNIANLLDVATNAWNTGDDQPLYLDRIRKIYGNEPITGIEQKVDLAKITANKSGIVYIPLQSTLFSGPTLPIPTTEDQFLGNVVVQHSTAYENYFGIMLPKVKGVAEDIFPSVTGII